MPGKLRPNTAVRPAHDRAARAIGEGAPHPEDDYVLSIARAGRVQRPIDRACARAAEILDRLRRLRVAEGHWQYTNEALAAAFGVREKQVREYASGDKRIPAGLALVPRVPQDLVEDFFDALLEERREITGDSRSLVALGRAIERARKFGLHGVMRPEQRRAYAQTLNRLANELLDLAAAVGS